MCAPRRVPLSPSVAACLRIGRCRFWRPDCDSAARRATGIEVLASYTVPRDSDGCSYRALLGPWAARTACHAVRVEDPYLLALWHSGAAYPACDHWDDDDLAHRVVDLGLEQCTHAGRLTEMLAELRDCLPCLRRQGTPPYGRLWCGGFGMARRCRLARGAAY